MKILAVGAHPDDLEFSMCGTLIKMVEEGHFVTGLVLTKGEMGTRGSSDVRENEMKSAAGIIGYTIEMLDLGDTNITDNPQTRRIVANMVRKYKPDIVFAPYHTNKAYHLDGMAHQDHTTTGDLVRHALRIAKFEKINLDYPKHTVKNIIYYMVPLSKTPTFVSDVSRYTDKMREAMFAHSSQIDEKLFERLMIYRKMYGFLIGANYGEPFVLEDPILLDVNMFMKEK